MARGTVSCSWCGRGFTDLEERIVGIDWINHTSDSFHGYCYDRIRGRQAYV